MRLNLPHRKQTKRRSDIALTKSVASAIVASVRQGKPISKHAHRHLLLEIGENSPSISINTYLSWMRRDTKPVGCRKSLREMVEIARLLRMADEAVEQLDFKKAQKIYDANPRIEKTQVFKFGRSMEVEVTTSEVDFRRIAVKWNVAMRIWDKVEPPQKRPRRKQGLALKKIRWHDGERA